MTTKILPGATGVLALADGTILQVDAGGVSYTVAGSVPAADAESAATALTS